MSWSKRQRAYRNCRQKQLQYDWKQRTVFLPANADIKQQQVAAFAQEQQLQIQLQLFDSATAADLQEHQIIISQFHNDAT